MGVSPFNVAGPGKATDKRNTAQLPPAPLPGSRWCSSACCDLAGDSSKAKLKKVSGTSTFYNSSDSPIKNSQPSPHELSSTPYRMLVEHARSPRTLGLLVFKRSVPNSLVANRVVVPKTSGPGVGFRVWGLGFRVIGFRVLGFRKLTNPF